VCLTDIMWEIFGGCNCSREGKRMGWFGRRSFWSIGHQKEWGGSGLH